MAVLSPKTAIIVAIVVFVLILIGLYPLNFYKNNTYFEWGPPVVFFNYMITDQVTYNILLFIIFVQQIVNNWVTEVVSPWIINVIQNINNKTIEYSHKSCLLLVNLFSLYNHLHLIIVINGVISQVSFFVVLLAADIITISYINWSYIKHKVVVSK